ncbi:MAG: hypothetical protein AB7G08_32415 [Hyphomicrobiaceae bacterium]
MAAATQNQALSALLFVCRELLGQDLPWFKDLVHAWRPVRKNEPPLRPHAVAVRQGGDPRCVDRAHGPGGARLPAGRCPGPLACPLPLPLSRVRERGDG